MGQTTSTDLLHQACVDGNIFGVQQALASSDVDVNAPSKRYFEAAPLHHTAFHGHLDICKLLLRHPGINRNIVHSATGDQPVHLAAQNGFVDIVRLFLDEPLHDHTKKDKLHFKQLLKDAGCLSVTIPGDVLLDTAVSDLLFDNVGGEGETVGSRAIRSRHSLLTRKDKKCTLVSVMMLLIAHTDRNLLNSTKLSRLIVELFEAYPSSQILRIALQRADVTICETLMNLAYQSFANERYIIPETFTRLAFTVRQELISKRLTPSARLLLTEALQPGSTIVEEVRNKHTQVTYLSIGNKSTLKAIDNNFGGKKVSLLLEKSEQLDTGVFLALRNLVSHVIREREQNKFTTFQWYWSLQDLCIFSLLCEHSQHTVDFGFCTELANVRKQHLQAAKDNYCILKEESSNSCGADIVLEVQRILDEETQVDRQAETEHVKGVVLKLFHDVAQRMTPHFTPKLVGSSNEGTRNFAPNEFDVVCVIPYETEGPMTYDPKRMRANTDFRTTNFLEKFYQTFDATLSDVISNNKCLTSLAPDKKSGFNMKVKQFNKLELLWNEPQRPGLMLDIDVVAALQCSAVQKVPLRLNLPGEPTLFVAEQVGVEPGSHGTVYNLPLCVSHIESEFIRQLPREIKHGYKIAKALRCARLFPQHIVDDFNMASDLPVDEYVRTYLLKNCLLLVLAERDMLTPEIQAQNTRDALYWADQIYLKLQICLKNGELPWFFSDDPDNSLFDCPETLRSRNLVYDRKCCLRRKFMLKVVSWIRFLIASVRTAEENQSVVGKVLVYSRDTMKHPYDFYNIYKKQALAPGHERKPRPFTRKKVTSRQPSPVGSKRETQSQQNSSQLKGFTDFDLD